MSSCKKQHLQCRLISKLAMPFHCAVGHPLGRHQLGTCPLGPETAISKDITLF